MIYGFRHQGGYEIPTWAEQLKLYYFVIRVEGRDKSKRRRYYRYIAIEKLRLVEAGHDYIDVKLICKYLVALNPIYSSRITALNNTQIIQLPLPLTYR